MIIKDTGEKFEQAPTGTHLARCIGLIDIGTHTSEWKGDPIRRRQVIIKWEIPLELREDNKPFVVSEFFTMSLSEKANLRHALANWRGRDFTKEELDGFDLKTILGKTCQITVIETDKGKRKVSGVTGMPKGVEVPAQFNPTVTFDLDNFDQGVFDSLTDGLKKLIVDSEEYATLSQQAADDNTAYTMSAAAGANTATSNDAPDDDIPF